MVFTVYVLYNAKVNKVNYVGTVVKRLKSDFYYIYRKKRRVGANNTQTSRYTLLIRMLLLCGCVEAHPGPVTCPRCRQPFNRRSRLEAHLVKQVRVSCHECGKHCCSENQLQQHKRTAHVATIGAGVQPQLHEITLDTPILPTPVIHKHPPTKKPSTITIVK